MKMREVGRSSLLLLGFFQLTQSSLVKSHVVDTNEVRTIPSFAINCNFLCYSGILSKADGCSCSTKLCTPGSCKSGERCQTKVIKGRSVAVCCPRYRYSECYNQPRFHARYGRRLFYFRQETGTCHRFNPTRYDNQRYFRTYHHCVTSCTCRRASHRRYSY